MPGPSPKKATLVPSTPNPEQVLGDLPTPAPIVMLLAGEVMPRLILGFPDTLPECENRMCMEQHVGEPLTNDTGIDGPMAMPDVDITETEPDSIADTGGNDSDDLDNNEDDRPEFQYEKTGTYSSAPTIAEAEATLRISRKF
jgi:hypothetical protein